jgi:hypothetical protein
VSQANEYMRPRDPGKAVMPLPEDQSAGAWGDLRPAVRWLQRKRPVLLGAIVLVAVQVVWLAQFLRHMYFFGDDFINIDLAARSPFSWSYLTYVGSGHLMIAERAITWLLVRISLYNWTISWLVLLLLVAASGAAAFRLLRTLFGERPAILIPLVIYLLTPLSLAWLGRWTAALELVPLELAIFMAINAHVVCVRTGRLRHLAASAAWVTLGLLASEKALVLPIVLFGITGAFMSGRGSWLSGAMRSAWHFRRTWMVYAALMAGYGVVLAVALRTSAVQPKAPGSVKAAVTFGWNLLKESLLPGVVGGPWQWYPLQDRSYALAAAPGQLEWLALAVAAAVIAVSVWRRTVAWRAWALLACWVVLADMLPVIISQLKWYPILRALDTRYVADATPIVAVCVGLAFLPLVDLQTGASEASDGVATRGPDANRPSRSQVLRPVVAAFITVFVVGSVISAQAYKAATTGQPAAAYISNATAAIQLAPRGALVADGPVPAAIGYYTQTSSVIGNIAPGKLAWIKNPAGTLTGLRTFGPDGRLYPAWIRGSSSGRPTAPHTCWPARRGTVVIRLWHSPPYLTTLLRIGYLWEPPGSGQITVQYGNVARVLSLKHGLNTGFVPVSGIAESIVVSGADAARVCIGDVEVGNLVPSLTGPSLPESG